MSFAKENTISDRLKDWFRTYWVYLVIYVFFLYVSMTTPRLGDDWEVSQWYRYGIVSTLAGMIRLTTSLNGRVASLFFDAFFAYYDSLWCWVAPAVFTSIIYLSAKLFGYAHKPVPAILSFLMLLSVSNDIRVETYVWLIGNVGYVFVIALILLYFNIIYNENTGQRLHLWQHATLNYLTILLLAFWIGLWVENITIGFTAANILLALLAYLRDRKVPPAIVYGIVGCILSGLVLFATPGRLVSTQGITLGIKQQVIENAPGIMKMLVIDNLPIYLLFLIVFIASATSGELSSAGKTARVAGIIFASFVGILILTRMTLQFMFSKWYLPVGTPLRIINTAFFEPNNWHSLIFCIAILLFVLAAILLTRQKEKLFVLYAMGMISAGVMALAPYLGARTFVLTVFMVIVIGTYLSSALALWSMDVRKMALLALLVMTVLQMEKFYYYGEYVNRIETIRLQLIEAYRARVASGLVPENGTLVLPAYQADAVFFTANPGPNAFHLGPFKRYYHLPVNTNVIFDDGFAVKAFTTTQIAGTYYQFKVEPIYDERYIYILFVRHNVKIIYASPPSAKNVANYEFPGPGTYMVSCELKLPSGYAKEVFADQPVVIGGN